MMNFMSEAVRRNPFPLYNQLRAAGPLIHEPQSDVWMIFDYEGVKRALDDEEAYSSSGATAGRVNPEWFIFFDPPRHSKLRALVTQAFTPRMVANLEPRIRQLSRELLDQHIESGKMDLAEDFAAPLPMMVIAQMLGAPAADWRRFKTWSDTMLNLSYAISNNPEAAEASRGYFAAVEESQAYLMELLESRRAAGEDNLLTKLVQAEVDGQRLSEKELLGFFHLLLIAGTETTTNLIDNAVLCLLEHPDAVAQLRAAPAMLTAAIEEVLRYRSPVQWVFRFTRREVAVDGRSIPPGKMVLPMIGAANRDPRQFVEPDRFEIARNPNPHIAFGHGIHFCIGAALSRLESRIALGDVLARLDGLQRASNDPWEPRKALHVHGPAKLPVRFQPARHDAASNASSM